MNYADAISTNDLYARGTLDAPLYRCPECGREQDTDDPCDACARKRAEQFRHNHADPRRG